VPGLPDQLRRLADDVTSSATALLDMAYAVLQTARLAGPDEVARVAVAVCRAQPSMGALWNLAAAALEDDAGATERLMLRARRAPGAVARQAATLFGPATGTRRIVTCSRSAMVEGCLRAFALDAGAAAGHFSVMCAESRPGLEGRALAASLVSEGLDVEVVTDAAIGADLRAGDVVLVGSDAVSPHWFVNKAGTGQLCAAALLASVPAYVVSGREKLVRPEIAAALTLRQHDSGEVWADPPPGLTVRNVLFERVPLAHVAGVLTDAGLLAGDMVGAACEAGSNRSARRLRDLLDASGRVTL
jgi:translation initiation factor 2B subunit (eIF-2B alpha/beta/delta family)